MFKYVNIRLISGSYLGKEKDCATSKTESCYDAKCAVVGGQLPVFSNVRAKQTVPHYQLCTVEAIWFYLRSCGCLVTWFCYQLIAKPDNKTVASS